MAMATNFRRIGLLFWKNLTLRKRHFVVTTFEILLPTLFAILVAVAKSQIYKPGNYTPVDPPDNSTDGGFDYQRPNSPTYYEEWSENYLMENFGDYSVARDKNYTSVVAYSPMNKATTEIIRIMDQSYRALAINCTVNCTYVEWRGMKDEREFEGLVLEQFTRSANNGPELYPNGKLLVGIIFSPDIDLDATNKKLTYKLRFLEEYFQTGYFFNSYTGGIGPGWSPYSYEYHFLGLQIMLDRALIEVFTGAPIKFQISLQQFPYPPYDYGSFSVINILSIFLPQAIIMGLLCAVPSILRIIVNEKETGVQELLTLMGLPKWMHWLGYMINSLLVLCLSITIVVVVISIPFNGDAGAVLETSDPTVWWFVFFLYIISLTSFCFLISTFFHRPALAITVGIVLHILSYSALLYPIEQFYSGMSLASKMAIALIPNMALHYSLKVMTGLETKGVGAQWGRIGETVDSTDSLALYHMIIMFLINIVVYIGLTMYLENVLPSPYGLRKPWYYIFQPSEWGIGKRLPGVRNLSRKQSKAFETEPPNGKVGIDIQNLRKEFSGSKVAVDNMNLKMYEGQITALLGQNGAGKTTTMSILTGMFSPTSGTAYVNGYNITTEMEKVREDLGLCPQHNMLFNRLTVLEHLIFFARLKGMSANDAHKEAKILLGKLRLEEKENNLSMSLSGGQKRKLSLGCALITGTKIVILDEPTSGLDVENRRMLWDMLLEFRQGRTIVLTTHFMEEADVLGDRIAIMDQGKLICTGTPMFLKNYYGTGYVLKLILDSSETQGEVLKIVQFHVPEATINKPAHGKNSELGIVIPTSTTSKFPDLFSNLSANKSDLGIQSFGLAQTTMDDVFVRVGEISQEKDTIEEIQQENEYPNNNSTERQNLPNKKISGASLAFQQLWSLLKKKLLYMSRRKRVILTQILIPVGLIIATISITNSTFYDGYTEPPLTMTIDSYYDPITSYTSTNQELGDDFKSVVGSSANFVDESDMEEYYLKVGTEDLALFRTRHVIGASINNTHVKGMHSTLAIHSSSLVTNIITNTLFRNIAPQKGISIKITNHPILDDFQRSLYSGYRDALVPELFSILVPIGLALLAATFVNLPIEEKISSAKQLQLMTGVDSSIYWLSFFLGDFLTVVIVVSIMTTCLPIFENHKLFTYNGGGGVVFLIMLVYGLVTIAFSYLIGLITGSVAGGFSVVTIIHIITGIFYLPVPLLHNTKYEYIGQLITWIGRLFPNFSVTSSLSIYATIATKNAKCNIFPEKFREYICSSNNTLETDLKQCCEKCGQSGFPECFKLQNFLTWSLGEDDNETPGILQEMLFMIIMAAVYYSCLILIDKGYLKMLRTCLFRSTTDLNFTTQTTDQDVKTEETRVDNLVSGGKISDDALLVNNLCKNFGSFAAVSNVSFGVHHGECFGLLGVNGAGKTTTFRMLTGDEVGSSGNAYSQGGNLNRNRDKFLNNIGYCPQFDGVIGVLTGNEMLELFAGLRGVPRQAISKDVSNWMAKMKLEKSGRVQSMKYSGGMKRRLSSAMAMIGEPQIILLDEPTTGVDPVARREFWKTIASLRNAGQSIVLTSHSMEECEKLCTRLAIMVNGEFQCFGSVQHIKEKFAKGYSLTLKLKNMVEEIDAIKLQNLKDNITEAFQPCFLKDQHQNIVQYHMTNSNLEWAFLFKTMEGLRGAYGEILEDYSINQTTLEEVFLSFARHQYTERKANVSYFKKALGCCRSSEKTVIFEARQSINRENDA